MIFINGTHQKEIPFTSFDFSGGEIQVRIEPHKPEKSYEVFARCYNPRDFLEAAFVVDALWRMSSAPKIDLIMPYLPYSRQDRVCHPGESFALYVVSNMIRNLPIDLFVTWDVHSNAVMWDKDFVNIPATTFVRQIIFDKRPILISPDKGAIKRAQACAEVLRTDVYMADKVRNPDTGEITGMQLLSDIHFGDQDLLIVDDICDGGKTFTELAKVLKNHTNGKIMLYVTHGIFSKGAEPFDGLLDKIYTANRWPLKDGQRNTFVRKQDGFSEHEAIIEL